jgi:hypothetical protein
MTSDRVTLQERLTRLRRWLDVVGTPAHADA